MIELVQFDWNFDFKIKRDHEKNFLWALRLWVGRRQKPVLGYIYLENWWKNNSGHKGLKHHNVWKKYWWYSIQFYDISTQLEPWYDE